MAWECPDLYHLWGILLWVKLSTGQSAHGKATWIIEFERGMIVDARQLGHSISEDVQQFNISQSTVSCVYWEYLMEDITTHRGQHSGRPQVLIYSDQWHLARIVRGNRQVTLAEITSAFNAGGASRISNRTIQHSLASMRYGTRRPKKITFKMALAIVHPFLREKWISYKQSSIVCLPMSYKKFNLVSLLSAHSQNMPLYVE
jgi:hypothetical protein